MEHSEEQPSEALMNTAMGMNKRYTTVEEDDGEECEVAWGDLSGAALNPQDARKARGEEI